MQLLNDPRNALILLSALAGAVHVLAPDHWLPASVHAWQRGWSMRRTILLSVGAYLAHLALGILLYFLFAPWLVRIHPQSLFVFSLLFVFLIMTVRYLRFSKIREVFRGARSSWALLSVLLLLGPCECIIPVLAKAGRMGVGYPVAVAAFSLGTIVSGTALVVAGRLLWNKPLWLPRGFSLGERRVALVPLMAAGVMGLSFMIRGM